MNSKRMSACRRVAVLAAATAVLTPPVLGRALAEAAPQAGTVKVHAETTPMDINANEPQPACRFYLAVFGFTPGFTATYVITKQGNPDNGDLVTSGAFQTTVQADETARTAVLELPVDRLYHVEVFENDNDPATPPDRNPKQKTFSTACAPGPTPTPTPTPTPVVTPTPTPVVTPTPTATPVVTPTPTPVVTPTPSGDVGGVARPRGTDEPGGTDQPGGTDRPRGTDRPEPSGNRDDGITPVGGVDAGGGGAATGDLR